MYLEPIRAVGLPTSYGGRQKKCRAGEKLVPFTATTRYGAVSTGMACIRDPDYVPPLSPTSESFDLVGTPTSWSYKSCPSGYIKKSSGKPNPNAYACFKK